MYCSAPGQQIHAESAIKAVTEAVIHSIKHVHRYGVTCGSLLCFVGVHVQVVKLTYGGDSILYCT